MAMEILNQGRGALCITITGENNAAAGGLGAIANPEGVNVLILRATLVVLEPSAGAANLRLGLGAAATNPNDIMADEAMALGAGVPAPFNGFARQNGADTAIAVPAIWTPALNIVATGSANTTGLVARLFVEYIRID